MPTSLNEMTTTTSHTILRTYKKVHFFLTFNFSLIVNQNNFIRNNSY